LCPANSELNEAMNLDNERAFMKLTCPRPTAVTGWLAEKMPAAWAAPLCICLFLAAELEARAAPTKPTSNSAWPQGYTVQREETSGRLILRTPYYLIEHDLRKGGALSRITLQYGRTTNLLVMPIEAYLRDEQGVVLTDLKDSAAKVTHRREGRNEIVTVECALADPQGRVSDLRVKSTFEYRWGYVKIRREFLVPSRGLRVRELCPFSTVLAPGLSNYGYREGITEEEGAPPFSFGSNRWGKLRLGQPSDPPLHTHYPPRSMIFVDPGVEGLEWFVGSDLSQWDLQLTGRRGQGQCSLQPHQQPPGLALSISPLCSTNEAQALTKVCAFDFYLAIPLLEGHARQPWLHTSFNRNQGNWITTEEIRHWAEQGYQTVHCHNDGDYYDDGKFWRDGSYPPYPDMDRYDIVLRDCRQLGIRTATYFSNKELHPSTRSPGSALGVVPGRRPHARGDQLWHYRPPSATADASSLRAGSLPGRRHALACQPGDV
jgi:hypothetical protein